MKTPLIMDAAFILVGPLSSFITLIFFGKRLGHKMAALTSIGGIVGSFLAALMCVPHTLQGEVLNWSHPFVTLGGVQLQIGLLHDPFTMMMTLMVTLIASLIQIYSVGYMHNDPRFSRYFAYMSLFAFSMLGLVLSNTLFQLFIFWEGVGLCSYLLISFWFEKESAANAGRKAFITTRIGDTGFLIGLFLLFATLGNTNILSLGSVPIDHNLVTLICLLIFCGAMGKSAQFPLHVWLPDAMEGPTSVSALIHAATMVVAGVYLVARCLPLFIMSGVALNVVMVIGTITAFMAAFFALTQNDVKRVLAYSTISQLGYMMVALGVGGLSAGSFHLMTHAFFKALLFLCSGSIIHGTHTQDLRKMGGLFGKMKITATTALIATIAISGIPPFAGFWSKDEILATIFHSHHPVVFAIMSLTSFMTAFYMARWLFLVFFGKTRDSHIHAHESPFSMTIPLMILAVFSAVIGLVGSPLMNHLYTHLIHPHVHAHEFDIKIATQSTVIALLGIALAALFYLIKKEWPAQLAERIKPLYQASLNKLWIDELYQKTIIAFTWTSARVLSFFDATVIDGAVNGAARLTRWSSEMKNWFDKTFVDGAVNGVGALTRAFSSNLRRMQTGFIQNYLLIAVIGLVFILMVGFGH
jgi:NADH-quinone oxidoreductase subunit L